MISLILRCCIITNQLLLTFLPSEAFHIFPFLWHLFETSFKISCCHIQNYCYVSRDRRKGICSEWILVFHKAFQNTKSLPKMVHRSVLKQRHRQFPGTLMSDRRVRQRKKEIFTNCPDLTFTWKYGANWLGLNIIPKPKGTVDVDIGDSEVICHSTENKGYFLFKLSWLIQLCVLNVSVFLKNNLCLFYNILEPIYIYIYINLGI